MLKNQSCDRRLETIVDYYDSCEGDYRFFWDLERSRALHAGYWDETTHNLHEALLRENEILADLAQIGAADRVLDAGCGIGGSAFYLAQSRQAEVVGISLSAKQIAKAQQYALQQKKPFTPQFHVMDFTRTTFPDHHFDVVWGLESICHALEKADFIREAFRLLKPGGRLIVADGFLSAVSPSPKEQKQMTYWLQGWGVAKLDSADSFRNKLRQAQFHDIVYREITKHVMPSSQRLYRLAIPALPLSKIGEWLGYRSKLQTANLWAAFYQHITLKKKIWEYGIFTAIK